MFHLLQELFRLQDGCQTGESFRLFSAHEGCWFEVVSSWTHYVTILKPNFGRVFSNCGS